MTVFGELAKQMGRKWSYPLSRQYPGIQEIHEEPQDSRVTADANRDTAEYKSKALPLLSPSSVQ
jgi:hypothetical protein